MNILPEVNNKSKIITAEFVKLLANKADGSIETIALSNSYKEETFGGATYLPLMGLMSVSGQQKDLKITGFDLQVGIMGVSDYNVYVFTSDAYKLIGSYVYVYRGFYDENYNLVSTSLRYTGIVANLGIEEILNVQQLENTYMISLSCNNAKTLLENQISGRFTNATSWKQLYPSDNSMDRVQVIESTVFDFGKETASPTPAPASTIKPFGSITLNGQTNTASNQIKGGSITGFHL